MYSVRGVGSSPARNGFTKHKTLGLDWLLDDLSVRRMLVVWHSIPYFHIQGPRQPRSITSTPSKWWPQQSLSSKSRRTRED